MGIFDKLGEAINRPRRKAVKDAQAPAPAPKKTKLTPKEQANKNEEPWFTVIGVEVDPDNPRNGAFELDWNEPFIETLAKSGYTGSSPEQIIDAWFNDVCRNILMEEFNDKNFVADAPLEVKRDDGKTEKY